MIRNSFKDLYLQSRY